MKYKEFKKAIRELGPGLKAKSRLAWGQVFDGHQEGKEK